MLDTTIVAKLCSLFCFYFKELGKLKGQEVCITLDDTHVFLQPYRLNDMG
jgi:hypothetical protein